ncbi:MAG TPA: hypothetical protein V6D22_16870 [Candidatus Obscuribacterales bacterium]
MNKAIRIVSLLLVALFAIGMPADSQTITAHAVNSKLKNNLEITGTLKVDGQSTFAEGSGGALFNPVGILSLITANVASATGGAVTSTYSLPANTLNAVGAAVRVRIYGTTAANANTKQVQFLWGGTTITLLNAASNAKDVYADIEIVKTGSNTQQINVAGYANGALMNALSTTSTQTDTSAIAMTVNLPTATTAGDTTITGFDIFAEP